MGREIRRVPANWKHPQQLDPHTGDMDDVPMHSRSLREAQAEWEAEWNEWQSGVRSPGYSKPLGRDDSTIAFFSEWHGERPERYPDDEILWRSYDLEDATWFQVWQTVSEGSPTTPAFATIQELTDYLAVHGDGVDQFGSPYRGPTFGLSRGPQAWGRARAEAFTKMGWAPSAAVIGGEVLGPKDIPLSLQSDAV